MIDTLLTLDTEYSADSVECTAAGRLVAVGTYQLMEGEAEQLSSKTNSRKGRLYLYERNQSEFKEVYRAELSAILDMKWQHQPEILTNDSRILAVACAEGRLPVYAFRDCDANGDRRLELVHHEPNQLFGSDVLCLSLDWNRLEQDRLMVSLSDGGLALLRMGETGTFEIEHQWDAHGFEAWITAFDRHDCNVVYSGGDDCKLRLWDIRAGASSVHISKRHLMGVTSIQSHPKREFIFASGSYDENVFVWDRRSMKQPLTEMCPGGGVWRLKWHEQYPDLLLSACMYDAFHVLNASGDGKVEASYREHESLAYGVDWVESTSRVQHTIASCSFYDHAFKLWNVTLNE